MTVRSAILGVLLGLFVSTFTYFNDQVIRQTFFVGNHLPISVFGFLVVIVLLVNPLLRRIRDKFALRPLEIAIIVAIGLASCGWPGSSFFRVFTGLVGLPGHLYNGKMAWQGQHAMSYVPGCSPFVGAAQVREADKLADDIARAAQGQQETPYGRLWATLPLEGRELVSMVHGGTASLKSERFHELVDNINTCIADTQFYDADAFAGVALPEAVRARVKAFEQGSLSERDIQFLNRALLVAALPDHILPVPEGSGVLLENGSGEAPAVVSLIQGLGKGELRGMAGTLLRSWWPVIRFWGGLALLMGLAVVCVVVIVQPQWKNELLPYPTAYFVREFAERDPNRSLPHVAGSRLFWYGFAVVLALHLINGLQAWFPQSVKIPLTFDFVPLNTLFPVASWEILHFLLRPTVVPTVVAFTFFLSTQVSFSVGISPVVYAMVFSVLVHNGIAVSNNATGLHNFPMMRFGAYLGSAVMVFYIGRRYYLAVLSSAFLLRRHEEAPRMAVWATRVLVVSVLGALVLLQGNGLDWQLGVVAIATVLVCFLIMTRINAETGIFFNQPSWMPVMVMTAVFGMQSLGPTAFFMLFMLSMVFSFDLRESIMPFVANGLHMATRRERRLPTFRVVAVVGAVVLLGFVASLGATLYFQYRHGLNFADAFATKGAAPMPMDKMTAAVSELSAYGELNASVDVSGFGRLGSMRPNMASVGWIAIGVVLVVVCSALRTRYAWWPIHPVLFLVWGTYFPCKYLGFSILLGWALKTLVVRFAGAKGYHAVKPVMFGVIAGELSAGLFWIIVGTLYFFITGKVPTSYAIFHT